MYAHIGILIHWTYVHLRAKQQQQSNLRGTLGIQPCHYLEMIEEFANFSLALSSKIISFSGICRKKFGGNSKGLDCHLNLPLNKYNQDIRDLFQYAYIRNVPILWVVQKLLAIPCMDDEFETEFLATVTTKHLTSSYRGSSSKDLDWLGDCPR